MATSTYARRSVVKKAIIDKEEDTAAGENKEEGEPIPQPLSNDKETYQYRNKEVVSMETIPSLLVLSVSALSIPLSIARKRPLLELLRSSTDTLGLEDKRRKTSSSDDFKALVKVTSQFLESQIDKDKVDKTSAALNSQLTFAQRVLKHLQNTYKSVLSRENILKAINIIVAKSKTFIILEEDLQLNQLQAEVTRLG